MTKAEKAFFEVCKQGDVKLVDELLSLKVITVSITNDEEMTPLHLSAMFNQTKVAEVLIKYGASLTAKDKNGNTPLNIAEIHNSKETVVVLKGNNGVKNEISSSAPNKWKFARSKDGKIAQVVLTAPVSSIKATDFGMIMLPYDKFPMLCSQPWCTGFIRMNGKPTPYQMVRVDEFDEDVKKSNLTIGLSFCRLSAGSIFLIDTRIDNDSLGTKVLKKYPFLPPIKMPVAEWVVSLQDAYSLEMINDMFSSASFNIIVANSKGASTEIYDNYVNKFINCEGPCAHHERTISLDNEVRELLKKEIKTLLDYHNSISYPKRNFQQANNELGLLMPFNKDPIFAE